MCTQPALSPIFVAHLHHHTLLGSKHACALQIGITLVGTSSLLGGEGSSTHDISPQKMLLGMGLIVASQVSTALHICIDGCTSSVLHDLTHTGKPGFHGS